MPLALTRGFTFRITPVSRYSKELTLLPPSVTSVCVWMGTWSPTLMVAVSFSSTSRDGEDTTRTLVMPESASIMICGSEMLPTKKFMPGMAGRSFRPPCSGAAAVLPKMPPPTWSLEKYAWTP